MTCILRKTNFYFKQILCKVRVFSLCFYENFWQRLFFLATTLVLTVRFLSIFFSSCIWLVSLYIFKVLHEGSPFFFFFKFRFIFCIFSLKIENYPVTTKILSWPTKWYGTFSCDKLIVCSNNVHFLYVWTFIWLKEVI
jgi:hypothetical protein